jgi:ATPase family associated with various cellular activities (AAA)
MATAMIEQGRVISLEGAEGFAGFGGAVKVHRLRSVPREDVILPEKTLRLLDRNISGFVAARERIKALHFTSKKGLLFYGPPGTGKTHTIHYLASQLPGHTTLLVTAEQVGLIGTYFKLARFLQPAIMVIEDVDLIAREREHLNNPLQEALLNKLLNEMDGLREDADVIFILTTNVRTIWNRRSLRGPAALTRRSSFLCLTRRARGLQIVRSARCSKLHSILEIILVRFHPLTNSDSSRLVCS